MKAYRQLQLFIAIVVIFHALAGSIIIPIIMGGREKEIFPFSSWELFAYVPSERQDYGLKIIMVAGQPLDPPIYLEEAKQWISEADVIVAYPNIQTLGDALVQGDKQKITEARAQLEALFSGKMAKIEYEITARSFDILDHWKTGSFINEQSLRVFEFSSSDR